MKGTSAARSRSLIILRTSISSVITRSLEDLIPCRSYVAGRRYQRSFEGVRYQQCCGQPQQHLICTCACKYLIYREKMWKLVAGGGFDLYIQHPLRLPIVPASLTHCPR